MALRQAGAAVGTTRNRGYHHGRRSGHWAGCLAAFAVCAASLLLGAPTAIAAPILPAAPVAPATASDVISSLGLGQVPVSYVILVDISGSMADDGLYDSVQAALPDIVSQMSPDDSVAVDTFGNTEQARLALSAVGDGSAADNALDGISITPHAHTDMGDALNLAYTQLNEQVPLAKVGVVLLLTDGKPQMPAGTLYYLPGVDGSSTPDYDTTEITTTPSWKNLRSEFSSLTTQDKMTVLGAGLPLRTDLDLDPVVDGVFPNPYIDPSPYLGTLKDFIQEAQGQADTVEATGLIQPDSGKGVQASLSPPAGGKGSWADLDLSKGTATAVLNLTSNTQHTPLTVTGVALESTGQLPVTISGLPNTVTVPPGQQVPIPVVLHWQPPDNSNFRGSPVSATATLRFTGTVTTPWQTPIASVFDKGFTLGTFTAASIPLSGSESGRINLIDWLPLAFLVLLAGAYVFYIRRFPVMSGALEVQLDGQKCDEVFQLKGRRKSLGEVKIGNASANVRLRSKRRVGDAKPAFAVVCRTEGVSRDQERGDLEENGLRILSGGWHFRHSKK